MSTVEAVVTTGIYCRDGCPATPLARNVRSYSCAAAAEAAGYRACMRCRPYRSAMSLDWDAPELVCRAVRLVLGGALEEGNEAELGASLGISGRHLRRLFETHLGVTPSQLARSGRVHFARRLLDETDLTVTDIAFASGFGSVRQLHRTCREVFNASPLELRAKRHRDDRLAADGGLALRLPFTGPLDGPAMLAFLARRAIAGVERVVDDAYRRTIVIDGDPGVIELRPTAIDHVEARVHLPHWEGLIHVVDRARQIFALDLDPTDAVTHLGADAILGPLMQRRPGLRVPGTWDPFEVGVRAIVGQQISVAGATTLLGRLVGRVGREVPGLSKLGLTHTFPSAEAVAEANLADLGFPSSRARTIRSFAEAVAADSLRLDRSVALEALVASLVALPGVGPWTAHYIAMRLGERDAFPATDLGVRRALAQLDGIDARSVGPRAQAWRPWRALAAIHLWTFESQARTASPPRR